MDVFLEIVSYLDCEEILRLRQVRNRVTFSMKLLICRQVSKRKANMSRLRAVWEPLAVKNASMLLKKRVDVCTTQELERAVVQHRKASTDALSARRCIKQGTLFLGQYASSRLCLAPGGRWLLNDTYAFRFGVVYVDLDDPDPSWRQLIPPGSEEAKSTCMSLDTAYDGSNPSFHLALETVVPTPGPPEVDPYGIDRERIISVWDISPTFDSNGVIDGLIATQKFFHRLPTGNAHHRTLHLQGPYLLFSHYSTCSVIRWVDEELCAEDFQRKTVVHEACDVGQLSLPISPAYCLDLVCPSFD